MVRQSKAVTLIQQNIEVLENDLIQARAEMNALSGKEQILRQELQRNRVMLENLTTRKTSTDGDDS